MSAATRSNLANLLLLLDLFPAAVNRGFARHDQSSPASQAKQNAQVTAPARVRSPLFRSQRGKQNSKIEFNSSNPIVTVKLQVQDPNQYSLPNIRRGNFAVYDSN
jgi:hypothetical protein